MYTFEDPEDSGRVHKVCPCSTTCEEDTCPLVGRLITANLRRWQRVLPPMAAGIPCLLSCPPTLPALDTDCGGESREQLKMLGGMPDRLSERPAGRCGGQTSPQAEEAAPHVNGGDPATSPALCEPHSRFPARLPAA